MDQTVLVQDELAQALGFVDVALAQPIGEQPTCGFSFEGSAQRDAFVT